MTKRRTPVPRWVAGCLGCVAAAGGPVAGAAQGEPGTSVPVVAQVPASVRSAGLNGGGAALVGHAGSVFFNPAGLATIRHIAVEGAYQTAPFDGYLTSAALAWRLRQFDLGFGIQYRDAGSGPSMSGPGPPVGDEALVVGSLVYRFGLIAMGMSGKYVRQDRGVEEETAVSADAGLAIAVFDIMALGFSVQNIGGNWTSASPLDLPRLSRFGFTMNYVDPQGTFRLLSTLEVQWPEGQASRLVLGGEGGVVLGRVGVVGRIGYGERLEGTMLSRVTYGATLELGWFKLDLAYEPTGLVPAFAAGLDEPSYRFGVRLAL